VGVITLIIAYLLYGFVQGVMRRNQQRIIDESTVAQLARSLSRPAREVILWCWPDQRSPLTVGDFYNEPIASCAPDVLAKSNWPSSKAACCKPTTNVTSHKPKACLPVFFVFD